MLLDDEQMREDSIELDSFRNPPECVALPLKACISLKDLWVPSELLPSRNRVLDSNRNRPGIFHTLEKIDVESLSIYFEDSDKNLNRRVLTHPLNTTVINELDPPELYYSDNSNEHVNLSENELDNDKRNTNFSHLNSKAQLCEEIKLCEEPFSNNVVTEDEIAGQKSESDNEKQFGYFLDIINDEESLNSDSLAAAEFSNASQAPEKEEVGDSVQFINLSPTEKLSCNGALANCFKDFSGLAFQKPAYPIYDNTVQVESSDGVNTKQQLCNDVAKCPSKVVTELSIAFEKPLNECDNTQQLPDAGSTKELSFVVEPEKCQYEPVIELPIAYKRPALEEPRMKQRNQKEKKKKTSVKKNLQLGDFLQTANPNGYDDLPKRDEFYENLVRQGICYPSKILSSKVDNPSCKSEENFASRPQFSSGDLSEPSVLKERNLESDPMTLSPVENIPTTTLRLENISKEVTEESIKSLLQGYGELKSFSIEPCKNFIKVDVKIILDRNVNVDWLIACLDGTELFGASGGLIKIYKL